MENNSIEEYIKEQNFFKRDTPIVIRNSYQQLINFGFSTAAAVAFISGVVSAIKDEYGE